MNSMMNESLDDIIKNKKWHYSTNEGCFIFYFDSTEFAEYRLVLELDDKNTRYVKLKRNKNKFESLEVEMDEDIDILGGPVYSYKILLKFNKNGDISPVSTIYIRRKQNDKKMIALSLDSLDSLDSLYSIIHVDSPVKSLKSADSTDGTDGTDGTDSTENIDNIDPEFNYTSF